MSNSEATPEQQEAEKRLPPIVRRPRPAPLGPWFHGAILLGSLAVLGASVALRVESGRVIAPIIDQPLPGTCTFKKLTGIDCPGCGLTRCFVSLGDLQFSRAWEFSPMGILLFLGVVFQAPYRSVQLWRWRRRLPEWELGWFGPWAMLALALGLIVQWGLRVSAGQSLLF